MNTPYRLSVCLALSIALSVIGYEAWQRGMVKIDANAIYPCLINGNDHYVKGTRVSFHIKETSVVWMQCSDDRLIR